MLTEAQKNLLSTVKVEEAKPKPMATSDPALELSIEITGDDTDALLMAIGEAKRLIAEGYTSVESTNDKAAFKFSIEQEAFNYG